VGGAGRADARALVLHDDPRDRGRQPTVGRPLACGANLLACALTSSTGTPISDAAISIL